MYKLTLKLSGIILPLSASLFTMSAMPTFAATCEYRVQNEWNNGFVASIRITNDTTSTISDWDVNWVYSGEDRITNDWSTKLSGNNPYTALPESYNAIIEPGHSIEFGFQGTKNSDPAESPVISGSVCEPVDPPEPPEPSEGVFRVNGSGKITKNDEVLPVRCGAWFGLEGRHEPSDDANNPGGAPMELFIGNTFWANGGQGTGRTIQQTIDEIKAQGVNVIRLPIVPQTLEADNPQGIPDVFKNHPSVLSENSRQALEDFIVLADKNDLNLIIDIHSCSNYVGWRAGRLDAIPPYTDADREEYDFTREDYACSDAGPGVTVHEYNEDRWLENLREIASLSDKLGVGNILGIDIFNEPWDYTWDEWKSLAESAYQEIDKVNSDILIVVEGVAAKKSDGTPVPHGNEESNPNWGENFYGQADNPLNIPKERLVLSPHIYGPSVFVQRQFMDESQERCNGLEGDAAGDEQCNILIDTEKLVNGWEEHFGYLRDEGFAIVIGEFGGNMDWPAGTAPIRDQKRWKHIAPGIDEDWQNVAVDYMVEHEIEACYWAINPESGDAAGWYGHEYDPVSNTEGWGQWNVFDTRKTDLLNRLWGNK
ncbi:cellulase family glycosylhydrolase [Microbulbifer sp. GL-2]|uniref:cellulase family glycosylhydrolase n=1 Tax=Microbulbifer sp. GL-2 TaxID=2591606 RepID=UPI00117D6CEF|nr:cellulase family glycosylhydrolase [Microbulbifer sp. GL-2]